MELEHATLSDFELVIHWLGVWRRSDILCHYSIVGVSAVTTGNNIFIIRVGLEVLNFFLRSVSDLGSVVLLLNDRD